VLIADIGLPAEDGYALIRKVRALPPERGGLIPAVAVTAFASADDRRRALEAGYQAHVGKPFEPAPGDAARSARPSKPEGLTATCARLPARRSPPRSRVVSRARSRAPRMVPLRRERVRRREIGD
jgi:CheY-like chemotaxis protein